MVKINLVADIGNTHVVIGIYQDDNLLHSFRMKTDHEKTEDEYFSILSNLLREHNLKLENINNFAVSSVVPTLSRTFRHLSRKYFKLKAISVDSYLKLGLQFPIPDPSFIGADLIVNAFAARAKYHQATIICDFGTATTIQLVGSDGYFYGTMIAPGVLTSANQLFHTASKLSHIQLETPKHLLGTNTADALCSGIINGNRFMLDGFIREIKAEYKHLNPIKVIATGGIADMICKESSQIDFVDKTLTLDGLNLICNK